MTVRNISLVMCLILLSGCAGNIKDQICLGIGIYAYVMGAKETRRQQKEARNWQTRRLAAGQTSASIVEGERHESSSSGMSSGIGGQGAGGSPVAEGIQNDAAFLISFQAGQEDFRRFRYQDCKAKMISLTVENGTGQQRAQAYFYAGACAYYLGNFEEARRYFAKAIELDPGYMPSTTRFTPALLGFYRRSGR